MTAPEDVAGLLDRMRVNLRQAGIQVADETLELVAQRGFLSTPLAFQQIVEEAPADITPDYLDLAGQSLGDAAQPARTTGEQPVAPPATAAAREPGYPTLAELAARLRRREVSSVELTEQALARIQERDPVLNAFQLVLAEEALAAARQADRELGAGQDRGPLHGIPIAVKDLLAVAGTATTAGSKILAGWRTDFDAAAVERLRAAGAVIVGKTRLSEFAYSGASNNAHYGPTRNPWNLDHDTGGSSSGSAAAVADGMAVAALGSDTGGSIRIPAAFCGLVGLKPTFGRVSLHGAIPLAWSLDHLGPMTRSVADAAMLFQILAGPDPRDGRTRSVPVPDVEAALRGGVEGLRVGVLRDDGSGEPLGTPEALDAWRAGLAALERAGVTLVELDLPELSRLRVLNTALIAQEAVAFHLPWLRERLEDYGEFMRLRILSSFAYGPADFVRAQQLRHELRRRCEQVFDQVDLLSTPTAPYGAPELGDPARNSWFTAPFNALGWPAVTVPVGLTGRRLPLGLQLAGRPWDEATVLRAAAAVEAAGLWPGGIP
ncbi:amidase [Thermomicrobiaceae bacterium CFH 74404]|uniref:Amidase n=1 Tax=Thermalbibacter longus TaxID=2951981 RepID=A0AA41WF33_9BACT|nr:amidase [Thermalbibacter longus]MCM8748251.1 amidase [Thermalbibacter longus]